MLSMMRFEDDGSLFWFFRARVQAIMAGPRAFFFKKQRDLSCISHSSNSLMLKLKLKTEE